MHKKTPSCMDFNDSKPDQIDNIISNKQAVISPMYKSRGSTIVNDENGDEINKNKIIRELENNEMDDKGTLLHTQANSKIIKLLDYSNKFGFIYLISSDYNFLGISFNDFSTLIKNFSLYLVDNKNTLVYNYFDKDHNNTHNFDEAKFEDYVRNKNSNKELSKKCVIFKQIVSKYKNELNFPKPIFGNIDQNNYNVNKVVYVKDFMKVQQAVLFRLSNKLIQVCFVDMTEIILSTDSTDFIFKDKKGEEIYDSLQNCLNSDNTEIIKRIKYAKSLMIHYVRNHKNLKKR